MFEPELFRKQMCHIEESTCDIVGTFRGHPQSLGTPRSASTLGEFVPLSPRYALAGT